MPECGVSTVASPPETVGLSRQRRREILEAYATPSNRTGALQVLATLVPIGLIWAGLAVWAPVPAWALVGATLLLALFLLRAFVLMHDCGHNTLMRSTELNRGLGFCFGVIAGIPQYVWSRHHAYHHATNGDWSKYRGPLATITVDDYAAKSDADRRRYRRARSPLIAPLAGFHYLIVNPRLTWLAGTLALLRHLVSRRPAGPRLPLARHAAQFDTRHWATWREYRHMTANNLAVFASWATMAWAVGPLLFFGVYFCAIALAGGAALVLFTVQHNFEGSYASRTDHWDPDRAAVQGTSQLVLPGWLNWFTANIGLHDAHHLFASVPNYRLAACHAACADLFVDVTRLRLAQIPSALRCILWDVQARRIVSVASWEETTVGRVPRPREPA